MANLKNLVTLLLIICLQNLIITQSQPESIPINYSNSFNLNGDKYFIINYSESDLTNVNFITITSKSSSYDTPGFIYISFTQINPSANNKTYSSQSLGKNEVIINVSKLKQNTKLYINLHSLKDAQIQFDVKTTSTIDLTTSIDKKKFKLSDVTTVNYKPTEDIISRKIMFFGIGENIDFFTMNVLYYENNVLKKEYTPIQKFDNGYGVIIDLKEASTSGNFEIKFIPNTHYPGIDSQEKEVEVGIDITENNGEIMKIIDIMEHVYGYISTNKNCYFIPGLDKTKEVTILLNVFTQALTFELYNETEQTYSLDVFHNYYLKLSSDLLINNTHFCFKKFTRKEKEEEELGEISYDFQLYYTEDLPNIQSYLFPLVNGKTYTNSLKSGEIMIYRHSSFTKYTFLYSAIMNAIRGKPALYGWVCETYPECNLDLNKFNELKNSGKLEVINKINNYYINKRDYAEGNQEKDGEKMSEARKQYLSIVVCESTTDLPNNGECQYTIEIDNNGDEIELIPEIVHTNSFILMNQNYYKIKISDYTNTEYLNIYFTILTGNADINIYSDKNRTNIITSFFKYRHVHRKEIFEKKGDILENYYLVINSEDLAFLELKYETDFHYKGYKRLNPNEINIEFIKNDGIFTPYSIANPDYFYPIKNPKNNDFYFTIHPLDCSVVYKYNFNDEYNITYKHHEVAKDDINFGTSYGFELKLDKYFHTVENNDEDCAMLIYTGEKSKDIPLLIIEDMLHPSKFKETYYIYPFNINNDLQGIVIQIQFDSESLIDCTKSPSVEITFKIANQKDNFDTHTISKDSSFFISENKIKKYCSTDFYQCSLTIEIIKKDENENDYTILTNVHSTYESVEYVLKNKVYTYNLRPIDTKYFYTQIDKNEKGEINFMFNKGNAKVYAKMVEKDNFELYYNWNKRVRLPDASSEDLLNYDYLNNIVKYDGKNCSEGCELYFLIESDEVTTEPSSLIEVSFSVDKKWSESENGVSEMPLNKYVKGKVDGFHYKYYTITIPEDYQKISFNFYSEYTKAYIKLGKTHYCTKDNKIWEITTNEGFGRIIIEANDNSIKKDSLKGVSFSIGIKKTDELQLLGNENLYYYLEVQGLYNNNKPYYQLNSERSIICDTGDDDYCHALLYIDSIYNTGKNLLYALPSNNGKVNITAKFYNANDIEKNSFKDSIESLFPNKENNLDQKTDDNYIFLNYEKIGKNNNVYILLTIYSDKKNNKIKLITSGINSSRTLLPYNTEKLINFYEDIKFYLPYDYKDKIVQNYLTNIKSIKGIQKLKINGTEVYKELKGNYYIEIESYPYSKSFDIIYTENKEEKEQGILITYDKTKKDKLFSIEKNITNEIYINGDNYFPHYIYIPLEYDKSIEIEYLFYDIVYNNQNGDDKFKITGVIINKEKLKQRKINPQTKIEGDIINGKYSLSEKKGKISVNKDKIKNDNEYYLFITIEKESGNNNNYKSIKVRYSFPSSSDENSNGGKTYVVLIISIYIALVCLLVPLISCICAKMKKKGGFITINNNDINESMKANDDSLLPKNENN